MTEERRRYAKGVLFGIAAGLLAAAMTQVVGIAVGPGAQALAALLFLVVSWVE